MKFKPGMTVKFLYKDNTVTIVKVLPPRNIFLHGRKTLTKNQYFQRTQDAFGYTPPQPYDHLLRVRYAPRSDLLYDYPETVFELVEDISHSPEEEFSREPDPHNRTKKTARGNVCTEFELDAVWDDIQHRVDEVFFSFPKPPSNLWERIIIDPFCFYPYHMVIASVLEDFRNSTGSWTFTLNVQGAQILVNKDGSAYRPPTPIAPLTRLAQQKQKLEDSGIEVIQVATPRGINADRLKIIAIAELATKKGYYGRNNQYYPKLCKPSPNKITIETPVIFWESIGSIYLGSVDADLKALIIDGTVSRLQQGDIVLLTKQGVVCQDCHQVIKKHHICRVCGKVICQRCVCEKTRWGIFKARWCRACDAQISGEEPIPAKNPGAVKKCKQALKAWKRQSIASFPPEKVFQFKDDGQAVMAELSPNYIPKVNYAQFRDI